MTENKEVEVYFSKEAPSSTAMRQVVSELTKLSKLVYYYIRRL